MFATRIVKDNSAYANWPSDTPLISPTDGGHAWSDTDVLDASWAFVDEPVIIWSTAIAIYDLLQDTMYNNRYATHMLSIYRPDWECHGS